MQVVDPRVSETKFQQELDTFYAAEAVHRMRGIFIIKASFPDMVFVFTAPQLRPSPLVFAVKVNFDNYDLEPLSVLFIDPYSWVPLEAAPVPLYRKVIKADQTIELHELVQKESTGLPFICLPGIREYHLHPAHTGDLWLLHRGKGGEGTLGFILDKLYIYGIQGIGTFQMQLQAMINAAAIKVHYPHEQIPL
jgi:hypothetical protein